MERSRSASTTSIDAESLWQELLDVTFDVDEFLENYIKQHSFTVVRHARSVDSDLAPSLNINAPKKLAAPTSGLLQVDSAFKARSLTEVHKASYDTTRILNGLNDLFDACIFINSKAAYQHRHAEDELHRVEEEAMVQLVARADKVKLNLSSVVQLEDELKELAQKFNTAAEKISSITQPQERLIETHKLLSYFVELDSKELGELTYPELLQPRSTLDDYQKAASTILGLHRIVAALAVHQDDVYRTACERITVIYKEIEGDLVMLFTRANNQEPMDLKLMQQIAVLLQNFPQGFSVAISTFVDRAVDSVASRSSDPFRHIIQVCDATYKLVYDVFPGPDVVMEKFITQVVCHLLDPLIDLKLGAPRTVANLESYLLGLYDLYRRTRALEPALAKFKGLRMPHIIHLLFGFHLEGYAQTECKSLKTKCTVLMQQYYDVLGSDLGIAKSVGIVQVLSEEKEFFKVPNFAAVKPITVVIGDYLESHPQITYEKKLISDSMCLGLLQELRQATTRAAVLIPSDELAPCLLELGHIAVTYVACVHLDYGMEIGIRAQSSDPKTEPTLSFLNLMQNSSTVFYLLALQVHDCLKKIDRFPVESKKLEDFLQFARERIERKAVIGIEACLNSAMNYVRNVLSQQKKAEFSNLKNGYAPTPTATKATDFFLKIVQLVNETFAAKNHLSISAELGVRFHREVIDHMDDFRFTSEEAMILICDIKEYREAALPLNVADVTRLFDKTLLLANLLVTAGCNVHILCQEVLREVGTLESVGFMLKLREDFKSISDSVSDFV